MIDILLNGGGFRVLFRVGGDGNLEVMALPECSDELRRVLITVVRPAFGRIWWITSKRKHACEPRIPEKVRFFQSFFAAMAQSDEMSLDRSAGLPGNHLGCI